MKGPEIQEQLKVTMLSKGLSSLIKIGKGYTQPTEANSYISKLRQKNSHLKHTVGCINEDRVVDLLQDQHGTHFMSLRMKTIRVSNRTMSEKLNQETVRFEFK